MSRSAEFTCEKLYQPETPTKSSVAVDFVTRATRVTKVCCGLAGLVVLSGCLAPGPLDAVGKMMFSTKYEEVETEPRKLNTKALPPTTESDSESPSVDETNETAGD